MTETQFWLNWSVNALVAIGTLLAVIVALFGQQIRSWFFPQGLSLSLVDPQGELVARGTPGASSGRTRYFHLRVERTSRWSPATQVRVNLVSVAKPGPNGEFQPVWRGSLPFFWKNQAIEPLLKDLGSPADCDLLCVDENPLAMRLELLIVQNNLVATFTGATKLQIGVVANAVECSSALHKFEICWDGTWAEGSQEMATKLQIRALPM